MLHTGVQISSDWPRFKKKRSRLLIRNVQPSDRGLYQCRASIGYEGSRMMVVKLEVRGKIAEIVFLEKKININTV